MSYMIREIPKMERPRERFKKYGVKALSNEELLSILMRTGTKDRSVRDLSLDILNTYDINDLKNINYKSLRSIKGVGDVKAITILSAIEFGRRVFSKEDLQKRIQSGDDVYNLVKDDLEYELQEKFMTIFLDNRNYVIDKQVLFMGTVNKSDVTLRDVFREAVKLNSTSIILVHNHPGGSLKPSYEDIYLTTEFIKCGRMISINVIDHVIIGKNNYYSLRESNGDLFATKK